MGGGSAAQDMRAWHNKVAIAGTSRAAGDWVPAARGAARPPPLPFASSSLAGHVAGVVRPSARRGTARPPTLAVCPQPQAAYMFYTVPGTVTLPELLQDALILAHSTGHDVFNALDILENSEATLKGALGKEAGGAVREGGGGGGRGGLLGGGALSPACPGGVILLDLPLTRQQLFLSCRGTPLGCRHGVLLHASGGMWGCRRCALGTRAWPTSTLEPASADLKFGIGDGKLRYYLYNWRLTKSMQPNDVGLVML